MKAKCLMIQGTASSVGKSMLATALCRCFRRRGISVAPFKSQNMSLNSFITEEGHEIGRAQATQAQAAETAPSVYMNPVLLKPTGERTSQVVVMGSPAATLNAKDYYAFRHTLRETVQSAYNVLAARHELIVIEGAGSPAEINLRENDIANMGMARMANAPVALIGDIDRGGVFASLYGTIKLLPDEDQRRIKGCVVNKFRGDVSILEPGLRELERLLSRPVLGVLPWRNMRLDEEDSLTERRASRPAFAENASHPALDVVVLGLPRLSNSGDVAPLEAWNGLSLRYADSPGDMGKPALLIVPDSGNVTEDMRFLRKSGLAGRIAELHAQGVPVIGICGGFHMLGKRLLAPEDRQGDATAEEGLGLLDMDVRLATKRHVGHSELCIDRDAAKGMLRGTRGMRLKGHEFLTGDVFFHEENGVSSLGAVSNGRPEGAVSGDGSVFGVNLHGLFENADFTRALFDNLSDKKRHGLYTNPAKDYVHFREAEYESLADMAEEFLDIKALLRIIEQGA